VTEKDIANKVVIANLCKNWSFIGHFISLCKGSTAIVDIRLQNRSCYKIQIRLLVEH